VIQSFDGDELSICMKSSIATNINFQCPIENCKQINSISHENSITFNLFNLYREYCLNDTNIRKIDHFFGATTQCCFCKKTCTFNFSFSKNIEKILLFKVAGSLPIYNMQNKRITYISTYTGFENIFNNFDANNNVVKSNDTFIYDGPLKHIDNNNVNINNNCDNFNLVYEPKDVNCNRMNNINIQNDVHNNHNNRVSRNFFNNQYDQIINSNNFMAQYF
jgi:hypothetical protein